MYTGQGSGYKNMQLQLDAKKAAIKAFVDGVVQMRAYLSSDKFKTDTTVQVQDMLTRLSEMIDSAISQEEKVLASVPTVLHEKIEKPKTYRRNKATNEVSLSQRGKRNYNEYEYGTMINGVFTPIHLTSTSTTQTATTM